MHPPRGSIEPGLLVKNLVLGDTVYFKKESRPNFILVDCDASQRQSDASGSPKLVYRHMDMEEALHQRGATYSFLSFWPYPALDFRQAPTPDATTTSGKRDTLLDANVTAPPDVVAVDATTLWLAYKADLTKTWDERAGDWESPLRLNTHLLVELPFVQGRPSSYSAHDLHAMHIICMTAERYYVFPNPPNGSSTLRAGEYPPFLASMWHFAQIGFAGTGKVYVVDRLDREFWHSAPLDSCAAEYDYSTKLQTPYTWSLDPIAEMPEAYSMFGLAPLQALLRAALEGMWILNPGLGHNKFTFRRPDYFQSLGYGIQEPESRRYHNALLRTLLATTVGTPPCDALELRIREQGLALGIHLRPCLQPIVDPALLLSVALRMSLGCLNPHPHATTANYTCYLLRDHLDYQSPTPYWFGLVSTQRPHPAVPTYMTHHESPAVPGAFPQGLGPDIPPMLPGPGFGTYFNVQLRVKLQEKVGMPGKELGFVAPVFPVPDSASAYKRALVRAQTAGQHIADARRRIDIANIPEAVLQDGCRLLLLGEWRTMRHEVLPQFEASASDEFMPLRALLIRRCTCIEEPKPRWQQVAVLSLPHGWWDREAQGAELAGFRMAQPGESLEEHRCPWGVLPAVGRFVECLTEDVVNPKSNSRWSDSPSELLERQRKVEERKREAQREAQERERQAQREARERERKTRTWTIPFL